ncbi:MAG: helix-turn-helix domain-containing protein [Pseudomonadota bacterium]
MPKFIESPIGKKFGRLVVLSKIDQPTKNSKWLCLCDCGKERGVFLKALRAGATVSCGCFRVEHSREQATTHGQSRKSLHTPEYMIWAAMKRRCTNKNTKEWPNYGGRGISFCARWTEFEMFFLDMGPRPEGMTLDRQDNNGNYGPENCHWVSRIDQANNMRSNFIVLVEGQKMTFTQACKHHNVPTTTAWSRKVRGWPQDRWFIPKTR